MNSTKSLFERVLRLFLLYVLFIVFFVAGGMAVLNVLPASAASEPGLVSEGAGLLIIAFANVLVIVSLVEASRWSGWKLWLSLALAYYGVVTFLTQVETWYFLSAVSVSPELLTRLFMMGIPTSFLFIPLAVWILGKARTAKDTSPGLTFVLPVRQWVWKGALLVAVHLLLYFGAGYFIAWQNPDLRAFYGRPGDAKSFLAQMAYILLNDPQLFVLQVFRALVWILCALPVIRSSRVSTWWTALLVGIFFSIPQNIVHIVANPLLPIASVRFSHMIETALSTLAFGAIVVWLLHREHHSLADLLGIHREHENSANA